jgi:hypothetical protein
MIPFSTWSKSRHEFEVAGEQGHEAWSYPAEPSEADIELTDLMAELVEDLMTASVVQLRSALQDVGKQWADQQTIRQELMISREMEKIEERVISAVADVLIPVLSDLQLRDVMREFAATLQKLLPEFGGQNLLIKAPEDIHQMLNKALEGQKILADMEVSEGRDVTISGNQVVLVASLDAWTQKLKAVVAQ